jgi:LysM repeat protein
VALLSRFALIAAVCVAGLSVPDVSHADSEYVVQNGDTLFGIAQRLDIRLADLMRANNLTATSVIMPGQQLTVPAGAASPAPAPTGGATYTVRPGDWLSRIADRHNVSLAALLAANNLTATSLIMPGQQLTVPAGAASPAPAPVASSPNTGTPVDTVVSFAMAQLGKPYQFFTAGPTTYDCSGLTLAAYAQIGVTLIHHSTSQAGQGTAVDFSSEPIRPGDLIFLATRGSSTINHVGMAVSATTWIQSRRPGDVVRLAPLPPKGIIMAVRRFAPAN